MKFKKRELTETVHKYPGKFVDSHTFLDPNGNPYDLIPSDLGDDTIPTPPPQPPRGKILIDRDGKRKKFVPGFGWREF